MNLTIMRTGKNKLNNARAGGSKLGNSRMETDELDDYTMGDQELVDFRMGDGDLNDNRTGNGELDDYGMGDEELGSHRVEHSDPNNHWARGNETNVHATGSVVDSGMNCIRPQVNNFNTNKCCSLDALNPLPWKNAPKPDGSIAEFNKRLNHCREYLHKFAMHTPYYFLNLKAKDIRPQNARGASVTPMEKGVGGGKKQKRKFAKITRGQLQHI